VRQEAALETRSLASIEWQGSAQRWSSEERRGKREELTRRQKGALLLYQDCAEDKDGATAHVVLSVGRKPYGGQDRAGVRRQRDSMSGRLAWT
jgi:hypothetical protein